jgi:hypothetical protein
VGKKDNIMFKFIFIMVFIFSFPFISYSGEKWSKTDIALETTWQVINIMDWRQTVQIANNPEQYNENNPILGIHPSEQYVNTYFLIGAILHPIVTEMLPVKYRLWGVDVKPKTIWQSISIGMSGACVVNNFSIGLSVNF